MQLEQLPQSQDHVAMTAFPNALSAVSQKGPKSQATTSNRKVYSLPVTRMSDPLDISGVQHTPGDRFATGYFKAAPVVGELDAFPMQPLHEEEEGQAALAEDPMAHQLIHQQNEINADDAPQMTIAPTTDTSTTVDKKKTKAIAKTVKPRPLPQESIHRVRAAYGLTPIEDDKLRNYGLVCVRDHNATKNTGGCPLGKSCPYRHVERSSDWKVLLVPVPTHVCKFFHQQGRCQKKSCTYFHGSAEHLQRLQASGKKTMLPSEGMKVADWGIDREQLAEREAKEAAAQAKAHQEGSGTNNTGVHVGNHMLEHMQWRQQIGALAMAPQFGYYQNQVQQSWCGYPGFVPAAYATFYPP